MKKFLFHDLELDIPDDVYYPREDSVLLAEVLDDLMLKNKNCLEMGCGAGLSSIVMAKKEASVTSVDVDVEAVKAVKHNSDKLSLNITALQSNLFNNINDKFDLITFNPPYLPDGQEQYMKYLEDVKHQLFGGKTGREIIEKFLEESKSHLKKNGKILLQISTITGENEVLELCYDFGFRTKILKRKKIPHEELMVIELS